MNTIAAEWLAAALVLVLALFPSPGTTAPHVEGVETGTPSRHENPDVVPGTSIALRLVVQGDSISVNISKTPLRKVLAKLAEQANIKVFVADTVPDDELSVAFDKLQFESAIKRLLLGKGYALRYAKADSVGKDVSKRKIAEIYVVPQSSVATAPYRMEQVGVRMEEEIGKDASLLKKALQAEKAAERAAALKKYLEEAEDPDYAAVAKALKDTDPRVRKVALQGMEDSNTFPVEATAEAALTDAEPALRMNALRILVESRGGAAQATLDQALGDPDARVRAHAQEMAKLAKAREAFRAKRKARSSK